MKKVCNKCKEEKEIVEFYKNSHSSDGRKSICKICTSKTAKKFYDENWDKLKESRDNYFIKNKEVINKRNRERFRTNPELKKKNRIRPYNITQEQLDELFEKSEYKCNICSISREEHRMLYNKDLHIDHCHESNEVRGLLCHRCNLALGYLRDDINLFEKSIEYLKKFE